MQDDNFQPSEDVLPYNKFSIRVTRKRIHYLQELLAAITDEEYLELRRGVAKYWRAFVWQPEVGGLAYDYTIHSLEQSMIRFAGGEYHPLGHNKHHSDHERHV
jgi:hypothetical protein